MPEAALGIAVATEFAAVSCVRGSTYVLLLTVLTAIRVGAGVQRVSAEEGIERNGGRRGCDLGAGESIRWRE